MIVLENVLPIVEGVAIAGLGLLALRRWSLHKCSFLEGLGLNWDRRAAVDGAVGIAIGALVVTGIYLCELAGGNISRTASIKTAHPAFWHAAPNVLASAAVEECVYRGLLLSGMAVALAGRLRISVLVAALLFGLAHAGNPAASGASVLGNALGGVVYGAAFVLTGRLWLSIGIHFAWNFVQGPVLGFPVSGRDLGGLQQIHDLGPSWVTGGSYGPEGGLVGILVRFLALALVFIYARSGDNARARGEFVYRLAA